LLAAARAGLRPGPELRPFLPALGTLVPDWSRSGGTVETNPIVLAEGLLRFLFGLAGVAAPTLLVVEDVQWADPDSAAVIEYMADNLSARRVMIVVTLRPSEGGSGPELISELLARRSAHQMALAPLGDDQVSEMIRACFEGPAPPPELTEAVTRRSDGIPFFVEELLATALDVGGDPNLACPPSITAALAPRLAALPQPTRELIRHAALLGRQFDWRIAAAAAGCELEVAPERLRNAVRAQLLDMEEAGFRFRHALTVDAITHAMVAAERQQIAIRLLAALEQCDPELEGERCQLAASLADQAGQGDRAAGLWLQAARRAIAQGSLATAETLTQRAREYLPEQADMVLLEALALAGQPERVIQLSGQLLDQLSDPAEICDVLLAMTRAAVAAGRFDEADSLLAQARTYPGDDGSRLARIAAGAAQSAMGRDDADAALPLAQQALSAGQATGQAEVQCEALEVIGRVERGRDIAAAEAAFSRAHQVATEHGLAVWRIRALQELGTIDMFRTLGTGRLEQARREAIEAGALATAALIDLQLAAVYSERGEPEVTLAAAQRCEKVSRQFGLSTLAMSLSQQAMAHARAGRRSAMQQAASAARATGQDTHNVEISLWGNAIAVYHLGQGDLVAAALALDRSMDYLRQLPGGAFPFPGLWALVRTVLDQGGDQAREEVGRLPFDTPISKYLLTGADAVAAGQTGQKLKAERLFAGAEIGLGCYDRHFRRSQLQLLAAPRASAEGWGDPVRWLREALATFEVLGLVSFSAQCRSALRHLGEAVPRRTTRPSGGSGLWTVPPSLAAIGITAREVEVLAHLAAGRSNRDIAQTLFVSVRTVEKHVERILMKTGETRLGLAQLARRAGIQPVDESA
jgi:DNA-binding CsgD family transcriptional regulator